MAWQPMKPRPSGPIGSNVEQLCAQILPRPPLAPWFHEMVCWELFHPLLHLLQWSGDDTQTFIALVGVWSGLWVSVWFSRRLYEDKKENNQIGSNFSFLMWYIEQFYHFRWHNEPTIWSQQVLTVSPQTFIFNGISSVSLCCSSQSFTLCPATCFCYFSFSVTSFSPKTNPQKSRAGNSSSTH